MSSITLSNSDWIGILGALATIIAALIAWFASAWTTRRSMATQVIGYRMSLSPILDNNVPGSPGRLTILFEDTKLANPMVLSVTVVNLGNQSIERPPIAVRAEGSNHVIPVGIEDIPPGYDRLWSLRRIEPELCAIELDHLNPGQVVKAQFFLDSVPTKVPSFQCPMKDVQIKRIDNLKLDPLASALLDAVAPVAHAALRGFLR